MVLLHPGVGLDGSVFLPGARLLAQTHKLLLVDLPGNGHSPDGNRNAWSLAGFAQAIDDFVAPAQARGLDAARPFLRRLRGDAVPDRLPRQRERG